MGRAVAAFWHRWPEGPELPPAVVRGQGSGGGGPVSENRPWETERLD